MVPTQVSPIMLSLDPSMLVAGLVNGLVLGMIMALIAMGLSLIFGLMNVINFAHGAFYAIGGYLGYVFLYSLNLDFWAALLFAPFIVGFIGMAIEKTLFSRIYSLPHYFQLFLSFGLVLSITQVLRIIFGVLGKPLMIPAMLDLTVDFILFKYPIYRLFVLVLTTILALGVWFLLQKTNLGLIIRAGIDDREMAEGLGVNLSNTYTMTFALGTAIAGLSGILAGPLVAIHPEMGMDVIIKAFIVVIVGGLGSFRGPIIASLILMTISSLTVFIWAPLSDIIIFVFMAVFLIARPAGLFGGDYF
jgi:branched-chain amino acid transport system permease protein